MQGKCSCKDYRTLIMTLDMTEPTVSQPILHNKVPLSHVIAVGQ